MAHEGRAQPNSDGSPGLWPPERLTCRAPNPAAKLGPGKWALGSSHGQRQAAILQQPDRRILGSTGHATREHGAQSQSVQWAEKEDERVPTGGACAPGWTGSGGRRAESKAEARDLLSIGERVLFPSK